MIRYFAGIMTLMLCSCATDRALNLSCSRLDDFRQEIANTPELVDHMRSAMILPDEGRLTNFDISNDFLILSGGGPWGAFGAGFIDHWNERGNGATRRPQKFRLVTGVSTGALQSTYAFLGEEYDNDLVEAYTIATEEELVRRRGSTFFLTNASMADNAPLESYLRERVRPVLDDVAAAAAEGRLLMVGVVDALDGKMYAVDLTAIATKLDGREREDCYVGALLASSAVPIMLRQVTINGRPYFDGGVRQSVFVADFQHALARFQDSERQRSRRSRAFIVMNGDPAVQEIPELPAQLLSTLNRVRSLVFNQVELNSIYNASQNTADMDTYLITAREHDCEPHAEMIFDPNFMGCLIEYGRSRWETSQDPWQELGSTRIR